ncbi:MAG: hypothetical protein H6667_05965 [Ardenticatenaceae bacterium]|nr:hypothetical protein [Ardenticatenaceae bacterium]MCB9443737.1 hypothetical protein [Ardenticatenaceae bacterium]
MDRFKKMKPWQAFKTFAILFSFVMNLVLLIVLLLVAPLIIPIVSDIANPIVGGLNDSFVDMSEATISRTIEVNDEMGIAFTLPLSTTTNVLVVESVPLEGIPAQFVLPNGGGSINGQVFLSLPQGLELPVQLALDVPVDQTIPVNLAVDVDIPLSETELGGPFNKLHSLFAPLAGLLGGLPNSNQELIDRVLGQAPEAVEPTAVESYP